MMKAHGLRTVARANRSSRLAQTWIMPSAAPFTVLSEPLAEGGSLSGRTLDMRRAHWRLMTPRSTPTRCAGMRLQGAAAHLARASSTGAVRRNAGQLSDGGAGEAAELGGDLPELLLRLRIRRARSRLLDAAAPE